jgi:hypothetical protein
MNAAEHLGDDAELYALGALDPVERAALEAHVRACSECAARVAEAETVAAALATTLPVYEPPARLEERLLGRSMPSHTRRYASWLTAVAAVAAVLIGVLGWQNATLRTERAQTTVALATIVHSHFLHVSMTKASSASPGAKVLYGRDGSWLYVVADRPEAGVRVVLTRQGVPRDVGALQTTGGVSTLFVPEANRPDSVVLRDAEGIVGSATLAY